MGLGATGFVESDKRSVFYQALPARVAAMGTDPGLTLATKRSISPEKKADRP